MKKRNINLKNLLAPTDSIAVVVIIIGLLIAIFIQQIEVRLIGVSISILGTVAFFMLISQRLKNFLDTRIFSKPSAPPPDMKVTEYQGPDAKRKVFDGLENSLDIEMNKVKKPENQTKISKEEVKGFSDGDESFKVVKKSENKKIASKTSTQLKSEEKKLSVSADSLAPAFSDETSGMRIIGKTTKKEETEKTSENAKVESNPIQMELPSLDFEIPSFDNNTDASYKELGDRITSEHSIEESIEVMNNPEKVKKERIAACKQNRIDVPLSILIEDTDVSGLEPRNEFAAFVSRALMVIRSMASTTTAAFLIVNLEKEELILETFVTDVPDAINNNPKFKLGSDVVSQIVLSGKPEILTEINPSAELDLIPYYNKSVGISSFIGLPVFYKNSVIGVLCADTDIPDAYDSVTVGFLGHFTKLIGGLVMSYTEKHELLQASRVLEAVNLLRKSVDTANLTVKDISVSYTDAAKSIFDFIEIGIICYNYMDGTWQVCSAIDKEGNQSPVSGQIIELGKSMIGETILRGLTVTSSINSQSPLRIHNKEEKRNNSYFVAVPAISSNKIYGALYIETKTKSNITGYDLKILEAFADQIGTAIEHLHLNTIIEKTALQDVETGLLNFPAFFKALSDEVLKSIDFALPLSLINFRIDNYASFSIDKHRDRYIYILQNIINHINHDLKPYDIFGRINDENLSIALIGLSLSDAQLWAERLRAEIARMVININKKKYSVTISAGLAQASKADTAEILFDNANKALETALKKTNNVTIFA